MKSPQLSVFNFSITNQNEDSVDIHVDGYIVDSPTLEMYKQFWGDETSVSYKSFRESIPGNVKTLNLFVNSGGGHVGDAMAIHDYLTELEGKGVTVNREGRGIVASAATYLVMGNNSRLSENCLFMIHEVSGFAYGDVSSMENQVKAMRKFNDTIINFYVNQTGLSSTVIGNMMKAETWMDAEEAKNKGFVKAKGPKVELTNSIKSEHWLFSNTAMLNVYNSFITTQNSNTMDITKISEAIQNGFSSLMEKLGLKDKTEDVTVKNAFSDFSKNITDALKELPEAPDETKVNEMVNTAVTEALKTIGENASFKTALAAANKDAVTKKDLTDAIEGLTNSLADKLGGKKTEKTENEVKKRTTPKNRFSGVEFWPEAAKN